MVAHDCSNPRSRVWDVGKKHQHRLSLLLKHQIKVFPSICFPAFPGPCRQRSPAGTSLQSGMLTDVKEGDCAGLSCLVWPIITDQTRLLVLLKPDSSRRRQKPDLLAIDYPEKQWPCNWICDVDEDIWEENPFNFISFSCSNLRREFGGHFSHALM